MRTQEELKNILSYDHETGTFIWLRRGAGMFQKTSKQSPQHNCSIWNGRYCGKEAGSINSVGYRVITITIRGRSIWYLAHRLAFLYMTGQWPEAEIDHINGSKSDNSWKNLREATRSQNEANKGIPSHNTSGIKGVGWYEAYKKWAAYIRVNNRNIFLGYYDDAEDASAAYAAAANKYFGIFARTS